MTGKNFVVLEFVCESSWSIQTTHIDAKSSCFYYPNIRAVLERMGDRKDYRRCILRNELGDGPIVLSDDPKVAIGRSFRELRCCRKALFLKVLPTALVCAVTHNLVTMSVSQSLGDGTSYLGAGTRQEYLGLISKGLVCGFHDSRRSKMIPMNHREISGWSERLDHTDSSTVDTFRLVQGSQT
jgi:hypothetical protein